MTEDDRKIVELLRATPGIDPESVAELEQRLEDEPEDDAPPDREESGAVIDLSEVRHVVPDGDTRVGSDGYVGASDYMSAMRAAYLQTCREGVAGLLAEVATMDDEMARKVANTDAEAMAEALFQRACCPSLRRISSRAGRSSLSAL